MTAFLVSCLLLILLALGFLLVPLIALRSGKPAGSPGKSPAKARNATV
jgi:hypothetical protein